MTEQATPSQQRGLVAEGLTAFARRVDEVAREAGAAIMEVYGRADFEASAKTDGSPVTVADLASDQVLLRGLRDLEPGAPVVSEEGDEAERTGERYWLVDPLDGTREFLSRNGEFCVCIALIDGGRPVFGLIHAPTTRETYYAADTSGQAFRLRENDAAPEGLPVRRGISMASAGLRVGVSRSHRDAATTAFLDGLDAPAPVPMGSALKFCAIAAGTLDVYIRQGPTMHWDTAAGQCLLEAVGLGVYRLDTREPMRYDTPTRKNPAFLAGPRPA